MGVEAGAILFDRAKIEKVPAGFAFLARNVPVTDRPGRREAQWRV
jgi:hypothetical protein